MSPTVLRIGPFRFYFFSREEPRMHVHVATSEAEAKFWLEPEVAQAQNYGLSDQQLRTAQGHVEAHADDFRAAWKKHFGG
jgi:hypothetical protein